MSGRGPTRLMSPTTTFHNCGSSSSLNRRRKPPNRVTRGSPKTVTWVAGPPGRIVRILWSRNRCPPRPMRSWLKMPDAPVSHRATTPSSTSSGADRTNAGTQRPRSRNLLRNRLAGVNGWEEPSPSPGIPRPLHGGPDQMFQCAHLVGREALCPPTYTPIANERCRRIQVDLRHPRV